MITKDGLGPLVRIDGKFTANKYCEILTTVAHRELAKVHFSGAGPVFQHDRSPVHTSKKVEALLRQLNIAVLEWPPQSPDFNIIENIWGQMKAALASKPLHGMSRDSLWRAVHAEWKRLKLDATLVDSLYSSLPRRMPAAIASGEMQPGIKIRLRISSDIAPCYLDCLRKEEDHHLGFICSRGLGFIVY